MSNKIPFRQMRQALKTAQAAVALMLAVEGLDWSQQDYAMFFILNQMWEKTDNPTYPQMIAQVVAWLRFFKRLIDCLPVSHATRLEAESEFQKISAPYRELVEVTST